jgi:hypothetical protein
VSDGLKIGLKNCSNGDRILKVGAISQRVCRSKRCCDNATVLIEPGLCDVDGERKERGRNLWCGGRVLCLRNPGNGNSLFNATVRCSDWEHWVALNSTRQ